LAFLKEAGTDPYGEGRGVYRILVGKPEGERPVGRPRCRWEDNIKMDIRVIGIDGTNWIRLASFCQHGDEHPVFLKR
jgi:hypothetical protein